MIPSARQGEVWDAVMGPVGGREQDGFRPVLVISTDEFSEGPLDLAHVVPFTRTHITAFDVEVSPPQGGLAATSWALPHHARSISRARLKRKRGLVSSATLGEVEKVLRLLTRVD
jgi:mRNA interferase MazF